MLKNKSYNQRWANEGFSKDEAKKWRKAIRFWNVSWGSADESSFACYLRERGYESSHFNEGTPAEERYALIGDYEEQIRSFTWCSYCQKRIPVEKAYHSEDKTYCLSNCFLIGENNQEIRKLSRITSRIFFLERTK
jgi:hypothetical protein